MLLLCCVFVVLEIVFLLLCCVFVWKVKKRVRVLYPNKCSRTLLTFFYIFTIFFHRFDYTIFYHFLPYSGRGDSIIYIIHTFYTFWWGWFLEIFSIFGRKFQMAHHIPIITLNPQNPTFQTHHHSNQNNHHKPYKKYKCV